MTITRAISCSLVVSAFAAFAALGANGCSSSTTDPGVVPDTDTGGDVAVVDTGAKPDTGSKPDGDAKSTDTAGPLCDLDLPADFACKPPTKTPGSTKCTEATLESYVKACYKPLGGDATKCSAWKSANADCNTCIGAWTYKSGAPARDYCYYQIMTTECANAVNCYFSCINDVCADCASDPTSYQECQMRARAKSPAGKCYDNSYKAADAAKCFDATTLAPCIVGEYPKPTPDTTLLNDQLLEFYRGACRDNANWTNAKSAGGGDAGPLDGGADVGDATLPDAAAG